MAVVGGRSGRQYRLGPLIMEASLGIESAQNLLHALQTVDLGAQEGFALLLILVSFVT